MKILAETCLKDFLLVFIKNNKTVDFVHIKNLKKKSDILPIEFKKILSRNLINVNDISEFYVTQGPGSFMGVRAGLLFFSILAGVLDKKLFVATTLEFIRGKSNRNIFIDAKGNKSYKLESQNYKITNFVKDTNVDYQDIITNIKNYLNVFKLSNPFINNSFYMKEPKVG